MGVGRFSGNEEDGVLAAEVVPHVARRVLGHGRLSIHQEVVAVMSWPGSDDPLEPPVAHGAHPAAARLPAIEGADHGDRARAGTSDAEPDPAAVEDPRRTLLAIGAATGHRGR